MMMADTPTAPESAAQAGAPAAAAEPPAKPEGPKPIVIEGEWLTDKAKQEAEKSSGKPVKDIPYEVKSEERKPGSLLSLQLAIPADAWKAEVDKFYDKLRQEVALPGFRKGKAPIKLIRIRMGEEADRDAIGEVGTNVLRQELAKRALEPLGDAGIVEWTSKDGEPLLFRAEMELPPAIELKEYKGLTVQIHTHAVDEEAVARRLDEIRKDCGRWEAAPAGRKIAEGDAITIDLAVTGAEGQELKHLARQNWVINNFKSQLPEELAAKIVGAAEGETVSAQVKSVRQSRRGESVEHVDTYAATIRSVKIKTLPELDDELAKDLGEFETLDQLKQSVRSNLEKQEEDRQRGETLARLIGAIIEKNPIDVPRSMIVMTQLDKIRRDRRDMERIGLQLEQVVGDGESYIAHRKNAAEFEVKEYYISKELAKLEKLEATDEDLEKEIARLAEETGRKPLAVRAKLEAEKKLDSLKGELASRKVHDFLIAHNTVEKTAAPAGHDHAH